MDTRIKGQQYERLLKILFTHCDTVQCIVREDMEDYFEEIAYECLEKNYVTQWLLTSLGHAAVPVLQYTFRCHYNTEQFFKHKQSSLFSWQMPYPEDLSFWSAKGCLYDNEVAEATYKIFKVEFVYPHTFETFEQL